MSTVSYTYRDLNGMNTRQIVAAADRDFGIKFDGEPEKEKRKYYLGEILKKANSMGIAIPGVPDEVLVKLGIRQGAAEAEELEDMTEQGMEKRIRLIIHPAEHEPPYVVIGINGRTIQITREEEVAIQVPYFKVLENAKMGMHQPDGTVKSVPRFNYTVLGEVMAPIGVPVPTVSGASQKPTS